MAINTSVDPYSVPLAELNPGHPDLFEDAKQMPYFERLRAEDPVHYTEVSQFGPYWSVTKYDDLISMLVYGEATRNMPPNEYLGNILLLIVGGNDTTRNSISGGVLALNQFPDQYEKLRADHSLVNSMVPEIIRWQSPVAHMARTALADTEIGGKKISKGERVVMWYLSGNRDEEAIEDANQFIIDRDNPRRHVSFGFGIHRCVGNRLGEMQLRILWEEIMKRFDNIELTGEITYLKSSFINGIRELPVTIRD